MPEEIFILFLITILSFTTLMIVGMTLRHKSKNRERSSLSASSSLTTSELERMMGRAVKAATAPLNKKIDRLENILTDGDATISTPELNEVRRPDLLADVDSRQTQEEEERLQKRVRA